MRSIPILFLALLAVLMSFSISHGISSSPSSILINLQSPSIVNEYLLLTSNKTGTVNVSANSTAVSLISKSISITSGTIYNYSFKVNATNSSIYSISFTQNKSILKVPIIVTVQSPTSSSYSINIQGNVAPYSQIVVSVTTSSGQLMQSGTLLVAYNNVTQSYSLSTNPFPTISFGNLYGFVKFEYYNPQGYLVAHLIESSGVSSSVTQPVALSCSGLTKSQIGNLSYYSILPNESINCILYDPSNYNIITGANLVAIQNGNVYFPNPQDLSTGILQIPPPSSGWAVGPLLLTMKSSQYSLVPTLFEVAKAPNPSYLSYTNGTEITSSKINELSFVIVPNANLSISVTYPDGKTSSMISSSPIKITLNSSGTVKIITGSSVFAAKTYSLLVSPQQLQIYADNGAPYQFTGNINIGLNTLHFSNGVASGYLTGLNTNTSAPIGYNATLIPAIEHLPISIRISENGIPISPNSLSTNTLYEILVTPANSMTALPVTYNLTETGANNGTIPITNGQSFVSFKNPGVTALYSSYPSLDPVRSEVNVSLSLDGFSIEQIAIIAIILLAVVGLFIKFKRPSSEEQVIPYGAIGGGKIE